MSTSRIAPVVPGTDPNLAPMEARILAARGRISPLYQVLLNSPPVVDGWEAMLTVIRNKTSLSPRVREMVILRIAVLNRAPYEFEAHVPHARAAGMPDLLIDELRHDVAPDAITDLLDGEADVLRLTDAMTRDIEVPDAVYDPVNMRFGACGTLELTATIAAIQYGVALSSGATYRTLNTQHGECKLWKSCSLRYQA